MQQVRNPYLAHYYSSHLLQTCSLAPSILALLETLNTHADISLDQVRTLCFYGIPEECKGLRALLWRLLLGYLPLSPSHWTASLHSHRHNYSLFRSDLLSPSDPQLWEVIAKDIHRTRPDLSFFFQPFDPSITPESVQAGLKPESSFTRPYKSLFSYYYEDLDCKDVYLQLVLNNEAVEKHADVLARILYFYAKLNPGLQYIQGMNELLVPIYFAFAQDDHPEFRPYVEEDAYFCFALLMAEVKDNFVRSLDMQPEGLAGKLGVFHELLERLAPDLSLHPHSLSTPLFPPSRAPLLRPQVDHSPAQSRFRPAGHSTSLGLLAVGFPPLPLLLLRLCRTGVFEPHSAAGCRLLHCGVDTAASSQL